LFLYSFVATLTVTLHPIFIHCSKEVVEDRDEQAEFESGPLSVLMQSVKQNTQVLYKFFEILEH